MLAPNSAIRHRGADGRWLSFAATPSDFYALAIGGVSADDFVVTGTDGRIIHYVHGVGSEIPSHVNQVLGAVWGSPTSGTWIVSVQGAVLHLEGETITRVNIDNAPADAAYEAVGGNDSGAVYLAGHRTRTKTGIILTRQSTP